MTTSNRTELEQLYKLCKTALFKDMAPMAAAFEMHANIIDRSSNVAPEAIKDIYGNYANLFSNAKHEIDRCKWHEQGGAYGMNADVLKYVIETVKGPFHMNSTLLLACTSSLYGSNYYRFSTVQLEKVWGLVQTYLSVCIDYFLPIQSIEDRFVTKRILVEAVTMVMKAIVFAEIRNLMRSDIRMQGQGGFKNFKHLNDAVFNAHSIDPTRQDYNKVEKLRTFSNCLPRFDAISWGCIDVSPKGYQHLRDGIHTVLTMDYPKVGKDEFFPFYQFDKEGRSPVEAAIYNDSKYDYQGYSEAQCYNQGQFMQTTEGQNAFIEDGLKKFIANILKYEAGIEQDSSESQQLAETIGFCQDLLSFENVGWENVKNNLTRIATGSGALTPAEAEKAYELFEGKPVPYLKHVVGLLDEKIKIAKEEEKKTFGAIDAASIWENLRKFCNTGNLFFGMMAHAEKEGIFK